MTPRLRDSLWHVYEAAFAELESLSINKQDVSRAEFDALVDNPDTFKLIGLTEDGPAGMLLLTNRLDLVAGISEAYVKVHYPEHHARQAIYYGVFAFIAPSARQSTLYYRLIHAAGEIAAVRGGLILLDISRYHETAGVQRVVELVARSFPASSVKDIDAQVFYAVDLPQRSVKANELSDVDDFDTVIDLRDDVAAPVERLEGSV